MVSLTGREGWRRFTRPRGSTKTKALRSSGWVVSGYGAHEVIRLGANLILTRLLFPEAFGLMALVQILIQGLHMLSDVGIHTSIIQNKRGDDWEFLDTAWTMKIIRGVVIWIVACAAAWPFASLYDHEVLVALVPVAGLVAVFRGLESTAIATSQRHLDMARLTVLNLSTQVTGIAVMVSVALIWQSVWALVAGGLVSAASRTILSHSWLAERPNSLRWNEAVYQDVARFGKWILVSSAVTFFANQADRLLLGKLVSIEALGVYTLAVMLVMLPRTLVNRIAASVMLPALSDVARTRLDRLKRKTAEARRVILSAATAMILAIVLFGPDFFTYLYDPRYHDAGWMAQLLCLSAWLAVLAESARRALVAIGRTKPQAIANGADFLFTTVGCLAGFHFYGVGGLIVGYALGSAAKLVVVHVEMARSDLLLVRQDVCYTLVLVAFLAAGGVDWLTLVDGGSLFDGEFAGSAPWAVAALAVCVVWTTWEVARQMLGRGPRGDAQGAL